MPRSGISALLLLLGAGNAGANITPIDPYRVYHPLHEKLTILAYHDIREDIKRDYAADPYAVSAENLTSQFTWLRDNGYTVADIGQVLDALDGKRPLPDKSVADVR